MKTGKFMLTSAAALLVAAMAPGHALAAVVFNDDFSSDTIGNQPANWYIAKGTSGVTVTTQDDTSGLNGGNAMDVVLTSSGGARPLVANLPSPVTLGDGDTLQLDFDVRIVTDAASIPAANRQFRFSVANSSGTPITQNYNGTDVTSDDLGYTGRLTLGTATGTSFDISAPFATSPGLFSVSGSAPHSSTSNADAKLDDNDVHHVSVLLSRSGSDILFGASFTFDATTVNIGPQTDSQQLTYTFDEIALGVNSAQDLQYRVDNVAVTYTPFPEPASAGLLGISLAGLAIRRRR